MPGEYRLVRKLGGGGFGNVYLAEHIYEHSQVAIKILQVPLTKSEDFRDFLNEMRTMIRLRHPHITPLLDVGLNREEFPFLVMEYAAQGTVQDRHPRGSQVPLNTIVEYVEQVASALQYAHDRRIIHRDVKPENMLLRADGTLLLSDFGIAKIMEQSTLMSLQKETGTPAYMAPEQHKGYPCFASDQYALAVVAYEWISGSRPFQGSREWLAIQHVTAQLPSLLNHVPTFSPDIEGVIFKALAKEPEQRYPSVQEFAAALREAVQEATVFNIGMKKRLFEEASSTQTLTQLPATSGPLDTEDGTPEEETLPRQPKITESIHTKPEINTPAASQPPLTDQPVVPEQAPDHMTDPHSSGKSGTPHTSGKVITPHTPGKASTPRTSGKASTPRTPGKAGTPHSTSHTPVLLTGTTSKQLDAVKVSRRFFPSRRKPVLLGSLSLIGFIMLALFINIIGANIQNPQKSNNASPVHSPKNASPTHSPKIEQVLNTSTVSHLGKKWTFQTEGYVESSPAVVDGVVYVGSDDNNVYSIDALSGVQKWFFPTRGPVVSSPTVAYGMVYVGSNDGNVYALDTLSGLQKWAFSMGSVVHSSPAVVDGVVYIAANDGNVYAIDAHSGLQKWASYTGSAPQRPPPQGPPGGGQRPPPPPPPVSSLPVIVDGVVYVGAPDNNVYAIDALSGLQKWVFHTAGSLVSSPAVVGGVVYVGSLDRPDSFDKHVYAIDALSGDKKWTYQMAGVSSPQQRSSGPQPSVTSSPVVVGGVIYIGSDNSNLYALDAQSGLKKWAFHTKGPVVSTPAVVNGVVYVGTLDQSGFNDPNMYAIDALSGQQKWSSPTGGSVYSSPAVANNVVYVGSADGNIYAFGLPAAAS
jgi:outer membrane protein assembly factor BamB/serine/threonine protein kinase